MVISVGLSIFILLFAPWLVGRLISDKVSIMEQYLLGFATSMALFELICVPMNFLKMKFTWLCILYSVIIGVLCVCSLVIRKSWKSLQAKKEKQRFGIFFWITIFIIVYQIIRMIVYMPCIYGDDIAYITMINDIRSSDVIHGLDYFTGREIEQCYVSHKYLFTSYYQLMALVSKITLLHPLVLCKTVLSIFYMCMAYAVTWLMSGLFFEKQQKREIFLLLYAVLIEFGNYSYYTVSRRTLMWIWNSKSVLFIILLPLLFYYANKVLKNIERKDILILMIIITACSAATLMGAGTAPIMLLILGVVYAIRNKKIKIFINTGICCMPACLIMLADLLYRWS